MGLLISTLLRWFFPSIGCCNHVQVMGKLFGSLIPLIHSMPRQLIHFFQLGDQMRVIMLGLDNAGKTTVLNKIKQIKMANTSMTSVFTIDNEWKSDNYDVSDSENDKDKVKDEDNNKHKENDSDILTSTIGFNVESVNHKGINFTLWDVGGLPKFRHLWPHYYANNDAVIFVVDSQDQVRLPEATKELAMVLEDKRLNKAVLLVLSNKQDMPGAVSTVELSGILGLTERRRETAWLIQVVMMMIIVVGW